MQHIKVSEGTAARRRILVYLVDDADGKTAETGVTISAGDVKISKNGAAEGNHGGSLTELAGGRYYYEFSSGEVDTVGFLSFALVKTGIRAFVTYVQVVSFDPYDAVRAGLTALPNANAEAAGGLYTRGTGAGQINQNANGQVDTRTAAMSADVVTAAALATSAVDEIVNALWDELTTEGRVASSFGQLLKDNLNAAVSSRAVPGDQMALVASAITSAKFAAAAIDAAAIAPDAIGSSELAASAADKIAAKILLNPANLLLTFGDGGVQTTQNNDKGGYTLDPSGVDAIVDDVVEGSLTLRQVLRIVLAAVAGKSSGFPSGPAIYRDNADTKPRITATVDANGNRSVVTLDGA